MIENEASRRLILKRLFPDGIPSLWCPTLTHFREARLPDAERIAYHLRHLAPYVRGILVPGSTGEGWEMSDGDIRTLLNIFLAGALEQRIRVLIGILKTETDAVIACLDSIQDLISHPAVAGITVCPPKGDHLSQSQIFDAMRRILGAGIPTAVYQLPQVTQNEMSPETVSALSHEFENFILFKDTSGLDRVALSGVELGGVFMVRGAEKGGYARWPRESGGPYDGFLLSTANVFAPELSSMLKLLRQGNIEQAEALSGQLEAVVNETFAIVSDFPVGNAFANANKVLDHIYAFGESASDRPLPMLYSGVRLPIGMVEKAKAVLSQFDMMPKDGYLPQ